MKISVIMPVYNGEQYLKEAIDSILNQTFTDFEFIIINDCSTDLSEDIIKTYNDERIVYLKNEQNLGISDSLNRGIDISKGEYIARMDCDDIALPDRFLKQFSYMKNHPEVGVCGSNAIVFSETNTYITTLPQKHKDIFFELYFSSQIIHPTAMIRKSVLISNNLRYDKNWNGREDYELWTRMITITKFHNIKQPLLRYRVHSKQITSNKDENYVEKFSQIKYKFFNSTDIPISSEDSLIFSNYCVGNKNFNKYEVNLLRNLLNDIYKTRKSSFKSYFIHLSKITKLFDNTNVDKSYISSYIITCHDVYNYGASLQAYALQQYLNRCLVDVKVIDYIPQYISRLFDFKNIPYKYSRNVLLKFLLLTYLFAIQLKCVPKYIRYKKFNKKYLSLTQKRYENNDELKKLEPSDTYFCGSDQIWNSYNFDCGKDPAFFLDFAPESACKFSYAASFGSDKTDENYNEFVYEKLRSFDKISVREKSGINILCDIGIKDVKIVADPVFLLDKADWCRIANKSKFKKPYILVYAFDNREIVGSIVADLKAKYNLDVKDFAFRQNAYSSGPCEFLNLIQNADIVITNSFHAIAFSVIFNKQFIAVARSEGGLSERIDNILSVFDLNNRKLTKAEDAEFLYNTKIDYSKVDSIKAEFVSESKTYIERCIELAKENHRTDTHQ